MKYSELLEEAVKMLNATNKENKKMSIFSGIKHKEHLFLKVPEPLKTFDINSIDYLYVVEIWDEKDCAFRDYLVHKPAIGLDRLKEDNSRMVFYKIFNAAVFGAISISKELSATTNDGPSQSIAGQDFDLLTNFLMYLNSREAQKYKPFPSNDIHDYLTSLDWKLFRGYAMEEWEEKKSKSLIEEIAPVLESIQESHDRITSIIHKELAKQRG